MFYRIDRKQNTKWHDTSKDLKDTVSKPTLAGTCDGTNTTRIILKSIDHWQSIIAYQGLHHSETTAWSHCTTITNCCWPLEKNLSCHYCFIFTYMTGYIKSFSTSGCLQQTGIICTPTESYYYLGICVLTNKRQGLNQSRPSSWHLASGPL